MFNVSVISLLTPLRRDERLILSTIQTPMVIVTVVKPPFFAPSNLLDRSICDSQQPLLTLSGFSRQGNGLTSSNSILTVSAGRQLATSQLE